MVSSFRVNGYGTNQRTATLPRLSRSLQHNKQANKGTNLLPTYKTGNQHKLYQGLYTGRGLEVRGCASVRQSPVLPLPSGVWEAIDLWYHFVSTCQLDTHHLYYRRHPAYQQEEPCTLSLLHCYQQEELCTLSISFYTKETAYTKGKRHKALRATLGTPLVLGKGNYNGIQP